MLGWHEASRSVNSCFTFVVCSRIYEALEVLTVWDAMQFGKIEGSTLLYLMLSPFSLRKMLQAFLLDLLK